jgi:hypothetical protein
VPSSQATGGGFKIRVASTSNAAQRDYSDNAFSIAAPVVTSPFVGNWHAEGVQTLESDGERYSDDYEDYLHIRSNGTFDTIEGGEGTWTASGSQITLNMSRESAREMINYYLDDAYITWVDHYRLTATLSGGRLVNGKLDATMRGDVDGDTYDGHLTGSWTATRESSWRVEGGAAKPSALAAAAIEVLRMRASSAGGR